MFDVSVNFKFMWHVIYYCDTYQLKINWTVQQLKLMFLDLVTLFSPSKMIYFNHIFIKSKFAFVIIF